MSQEEYCSLCKKTNKKMWNENGFWGSECTKCNNALISTDDHKSRLTEKELILVKELIEKHYPGCTPKMIGLKNAGKQWHWFEMINVS